MKILTLALLLLTSSIASAVDFEAAVGHSTGMMNYAYSLGVTGLVTDNLRWRAGFASLGKPSYNHLVSPADAADDILAGDGPGPYYWAAQPNDRELYFTLAPEMHRGEWIFSLEGGVGIYRPAFQQDLSIGSRPDPLQSRINLSPIFGFSVGYQKTSVVLQMQNITEYMDWEGNTPNHTITTLFLRRMF